MDIDEHLKEYFKANDDESINEPVFDWEDHVDCCIAVSWNGMNLKYAKYQNSEIRYLAVDQNGMAIQYAKKKPWYLCNMAVSDNGMALQYIKHQDRTLCEKAIRNDARAFRFVTDQTEYLCILAINEFAHNIRFVKNKTPKLCKLAIDIHPFTIFEIENPSIEICAYAVSQDLRTIGCVMFNEIPEDYQDFFEHNRLLAIMKYGDDIIHRGHHWSYNGMRYVPGLGIPEY